MPTVSIRARRAARDPFPLNRSHLGSPEELFANIIILIVKT
jgi:hypothetical protein